MATKKRKGKGKDRNQTDEWGDGVAWNVNDFLPAWILPPDETLDPGNAASFSTDLQGKSQLYLPLYINNDGIGNDQNSDLNDGGGDGFSVIVLSLDSEDDDLGFSQETYILKESWDAIAGDAPTLNNFSLLGSFTQEQIVLYKASTFLVDGNSRPFDAPQLVAGGSFREATVIIEDAQSPIPIQLGAGNDVVLESDIVNTIGMNVFYAGAGNDSIDSGASDDVVRGENGNDRLTGGDGDDMLFGEAGDDILRGGNSRSNNRFSLSSSYRRPAGDYLNGGSGNDRIYGEGGLDRLDGMGGDDILYGDSENASLDNPNDGDDNLSEEFGDEWDILNGGSGNDILYGGADEDTLSGDEGDDYLVGGAGRDNLEGGAGADRFDYYGFEGEQFAPDSIRDFNIAEDKIGIYVGAGSIFSNAGLPVNQSITAAQFRTVNTAEFNTPVVAVSSSDRFIYNSTTGSLFFDRDGTGAASIVEIAFVSAANFSERPALNYTQIVTFDEANRIPAPSPVAPPSPVVQFGQAVYQVSENGGSSTITLTRSNRTNGVSQVQVNVAASTASSADYDAGGLPIVVTFGIGETSKTIAIPVLQDAQLEQTESVTFSLSSVNDPIVGTIETAIGSVRTARLEILDDDRPIRPITLTGTARKDRLIGNELNNMIVGKGGDDLLSGAGGGDRLFGGKGSDTLKGGVGQDFFALEAGSGRDLVQDFRDRQDKLGLTAGLKFKQLSITQQNRNTLISIGKDQLALLTNVRSNLITKADFMSL